MKEGIVATLYLVTLKLALDSVCSGPSIIMIPKLMDTLFAINISFTVIGLLSLKFYSKDYLFELRNSAAAGKLIKHLALYSFLDVLCLHKLSIATYCGLKYLMLTWQCQNYEPKSENRQR